jgi:hypothetical protein
MQQIYSRPKSKTKKTSHKKKKMVVKKNIIQIAGDGENGQVEGQTNQVPIEEQAPQNSPQNSQPTATESINSNVIDNTANIDSTATTENAGNGIGLNQNLNNQRTGAYTREPPAEKTGIEKKINSIRSGLSFHVPSSNKEVNRRKNEVMASLTGEKVPGFLPSTELISSDIEPKFFYHDFYPQNSIVYKLNLPEPDQEKMQNINSQNKNQH